MKNDIEESINKILGPEVKCGGLVDTGKEDSRKIGGKYKYEIMIETIEKALQNLGETLSGALINEVKRLMVENGLREEVPFDYQLKNYLYRKEVPWKKRRMRIKGHWQSLWSLK